MKQNFQKLLLILSIISFTLGVLEHKTSHPEWTTKIGEDAALEVIHRFLGDDPKLDVEVRVDESLKQPNGADTFIYDYSNKKLSITASSPVAVCRGFYDFLKSNGLGVRTWSAKRFEMSENIKVPYKTVKTPYRDHQYFNVVTFGYTTPFWDENRWDQELDWMCLHGIDMPLMLLGSEYIYRKVFKSLYGTTDKELDVWEVGPAHLPWARMGNMAGNSFDGPLDDNWNNRQREITHHILKRMAALKMKPIVPAFGGFIPKAVGEKIGDYTVVGWDDMPEDCKNYRINPTPGGQFKVIGAKFIELWNEEYEKSYGKFKYYLSDSFNEMAVPDNLTLLEQYGEQIYLSIKEGSKSNETVWVTQGWTFTYDFPQWTRYNETDAQFKALVKKVPKENFMVLYMSPEYDRQKKWEAFDNFDGRQWIDTMLPNMGGKNFFNGVAKEYTSTYPTELANSTGSVFCVGWGMTMEGVEYNELLYELIADMGWEQNRTKNLDDWVKEYGQSRFGNLYSKVEPVYAAFLKTVYTQYNHNPSFGWQGHGRKEGYYLPGQIKTVNQTFYEAIENFFSSGNMNELKGEKLLYTLRADAIEWAAFYAGAKIEEINQAIVNSTDKAEQNRLLELVQKVMYDMDYALTGHPLYDEAKWEEKAKKMGNDSKTEQLYMKNARRLLSVWVGNHSTVGDVAEDLNDYACRIFAGLIRDYYRPRLVAELNGLINHIPYNLREVELNYVPNFYTHTDAPPLTTPKKTAANGTLIEGPGFNDDTPDEEVFTFLQHLINETDYRKIIADMNLRELN